MIWPFRKKKPRQEPVDVAIAQAIAAAGEAADAADAAQRTAEEAENIARVLALSSNEPILTAMSDEEDLMECNDALVADSQERPHTLARLRHRRGKASELATPDECAANASNRDGRSLPRQLFIGYYAHIKAGDLTRFLRGYAVSHCEAPREARFQLHKFEAGYLYELHDGGNAGGVLSSVIGALETCPSVVIETGGRKVRVVRDAAGISAFLLNEEDTSAHSPEVVYRDAMKSLTRSGLGLFVMGVMTFILGFAVFTTGAVASFVAREGAKRPAFKVSEVVVPAAGLKELAKQPTVPGHYVGKLVYESGSWQVMRKSEDASKNLHEMAPEAEEMQGVLNAGGQQ